ncbi:MAG: hypothetical protein AAGF01_16440 [Cyanobacteria bacterium P01_G01_bin.38]
MTYASSHRAERFLQVTACVSEQLRLSVPQIVDIASLRQLPIGTFGRLWADTLDMYQLKPLTAGPRRQQLHDGIHVLTGYGVDPIGEAEVQAFLLGAKFRLVHLVIGLGLLSAIARQMPQPKGKLYRQNVGKRLRQAYYRGHHSRFDPDTWQPEQLWNQPVEQVRALFRV